MANKYLLVLEGGGDTEIALISQDVWDWIHSPRPSFGSKTLVAEVVPAPVQTELATYSGSNKNACDVSSGTCENDRALFALQAGQSVQSIKDLLAHCVTHQVDIVDEYHGGIY